MAIVYSTIVRLLYSPHHLSSTYSFTSLRSLRLSDWVCPPQEAAGARECHARVRNVKTVDTLLSDQKPAHQVSSRWGAVGHKPTKITTGPPRLTPVNDEGGISAFPLRTCVAAVGSKTGWLLTHPTIHHGKAWRWHTKVCKLWCIKMCGALPQPSLLPIYRLSPFRNDHVN